MPKKRSRKKSTNISDVRVAGFAEPDGAQACDKDDPTIYTFDVPIVVLDSDGTLTGPGSGDSPDGWEAPTEGFPAWFTPPHHESAAKAVMRAIASVDNNPNIKATLLGLETSFTTPRLINIEHPAPYGCGHRSIRALTKGLWSEEAVCRAASERAAECNYMPTEFASRGAEWFTTCLAHNRDVGPPDTWPPVIDIWQDRQQYRRALASIQWPLTVECLSLFADVANLHIYFFATGHLEEEQAVQIIKPSPTRLRGLYGPAYPDGAAIGLLLSPTGTHVEPVAVNQDRHYPLVGRGYPYFRVTGKQPPHTMGWGTPVHRTTTVKLAIDEAVKAAMISQGRRNVNTDRLRRDTKRMAERDYDAETERRTKAALAKSQPPNKNKKKKAEGGVKGKPRTIDAAKEVAKIERNQAVSDRDQAAAFDTENTERENWEELVEATAPAAGRTDDGPPRLGEGDAPTGGSPPGGKPGRPGDEGKTTKEPKEVYDLNYPWATTPQMRHYLDRAYPGISFDPDLPGSFEHPHPTAAFDRRVMTTAQRSEITSLWGRKVKVFEAGGTTTRGILPMPKQAKGLKFESGHTCQPILVEADLVRRAGPSKDTLEFQRAGTRITYCGLRTQFCSELLTAGCALYRTKVRDCTNYELKDKDDLVSGNWDFGDVTHDEVWSIITKDYDPVALSAIYWAGDASRPWIQLVGLASCEGTWAYPALNALHGVVHAKASRRDWYDTGLTLLPYDPRSPKVIDVRRTGAPWDEAIRGDYSMMGQARVWPPVPPIYKDGRPTQPSPQDMSTRGYRYSHLPDTETQVKSECKPERYVIAMVNVLSLMSGAGLRCVAWHAMLGVGVHAQAPNFLHLPPSLPPPIIDLEGKEVTHPPESTLSYRTSQGITYVTQMTKGNVTPYEDVVYTVDDAQPMGRCGSATWIATKSTPVSLVCQLKYISGFVGVRAGRAPKSHPWDNAQKLPKDIIGSMGPGMGELWWDVTTVGGTLDKPGSEDDNRATRDQYGKVPQMTQKVYLHANDGLRVVRETPDGHEVPVTLPANVWYSLVRSASGRPRSRDGYDAWLRFSKTALPLSANLTDREITEVTTFVFPLAFVWGAGQEAEAAIQAWSAAQPELQLHAYVQDTGPLGMTKFSVWRKRWSIWWDNLFDGCPCSARYTPKEEGDYVIEGYCVNEFPDMKRSDCLNQKADMKEIREAAANPELDKTPATLLQVPPSVCTDCAQLNTHALTWIGPSAITTPSIVGNCHCNRLYALKYRAAASQTPPTLDGLNQLYDFTKSVLKGEAADLGYKKPRQRTPLTRREWIEVTGSANKAKMRVSNTAMELGTPVQTSIESQMKREISSRISPMYGGGFFNTGKPGRPRPISSRHVSAHVVSGPYIHVATKEIQSCFPHFSVLKSNKIIGQEIFDATMHYMQPVYISIDFSAYDSSQTLALHKATLWQVLESMYTRKNPDNKPLWDFMESRKVATMTMPLHNFMRELREVIKLIIVGSMASGDTDTAFTNTLIHDLLLGWLKRQTRIRFHAWAKGDDGLIVCEAREAQILLDSWLELTRSVGLDASSSRISCSAEAEFLSCQLLMLPTTCRLIRKSGRVLERGGWTPHLSLREARMYRDGHTGMRKLGMRLFRAKACSDLSELHGVPVLHAYCMMRERLSRGARPLMKADFCRQIEQATGQAIRTQAQFESSLEAIVKRSRNEVITREARLAYQELTELSPEQQVSLETYFNNVTVLHSTLRHEAMWSLLNII